MTWWSSSCLEIDTLEHDTFSLSVVRAMGGMFSTCPDEAARDGAASPPADSSRPLPPGRGVFAVPLPAHGRDAAIRVYYYLPPAERFDPARTPVLFVLHGLQRNAVDYFDALMASGALPVRESGEEEEMEGSALHWRSARALALVVTRSKFEFEFALVVVRFKFEFKFKFKFKYKYKSISVQGSPSGSPC